MITVTTYKELEFYIKLFRDGNADLLILESRGGYGKSTIVNKVMEETRHLKILSHVTPMMFFISGYLYKDCPVICDDTDSLVTNKENVAILKMLCETQKTKEISWLTTSKILSRDNIPKSYETKSKVMIICNSFNILNRNVSSLTDRGFHIKFVPSKQELLTKIREIAINYKNEVDIEDIIKIIEEYARFSRISLRTFVKGCFLYKQDKENFRDRLLQEMELNPKLILLDKLLQKYDSDSERLTEWENNGLSRATFYRYKQSLKVSQEIKNAKEVITPIIQKVWDYEIKIDINIQTKRHTRYFYLNKEEVKDYFVL